MILILVKIYKQASLKITYVSKNQFTKTATYCKVTRTMHVKFQTIVV